MKAASAARVERLVRKPKAGETGATGMSEVRFVRKRSEELTPRVNPTEFTEADRAS